MRIFYQEKQNKIFVTPFLCGSSYLLNNANTFSLISFLPTDDKTSKQMMFLQELLKQPNISKTFIYRNPVERVLSFYNKFLFNKTKTSGSRYNSEFIFKCPASTVKKTFWGEMVCSLPLFEKHYKTDLHTAPQFTFFEMFDENVNDYTVYDVDDFTKWLYLEFLVRETSISHSFINHTMDGNIIGILNLYDRLKKLYEVDYSKIEPLVNRL